MVDGDGIVELAKVVDHLRGQARINLQKTERFGNGRDRHELLEDFMQTGSRLALECYRAFYIAESFNATADEIEDWSLVVATQQRAADRDTIDALVAALEAEQVFVDTSLAPSTQKTVREALALARGGK